MNIILVGMRCCGKSSIGKLLAGKLDKKFVDIDDEIIKKEGKSIPEIIEEKGWEHFRKQEKAVTKEIAKNSDQIISTGGGTIVDLENAKALKKSGKIIYLYITPETSIARQLKKKDRPPLTNRENLEEEVKEIYRNRNGIYCQHAEIIIERSNDRKKDTELIIEKIKLYA